MHKHVALRTVSKFMLPFILLFGFYIQIHGEDTPGGGFQAGVIIASAFILHALLSGPEVTLTFFPLRFFRFLAAIGVLLYGGTGIASLFFSGSYLDYSVLAENSVSGQRLGIMLIEWGVGFTVCSVMLIIFFTFALRNTHPS